MQVVLGNAGSASNLGSAGNIGNAGSASNEGTVGNLGNAR